MTPYTPRPSANNSDEPFDLSRIFIGREHQLDLFQIYLNRWKQLILNTPRNNAPVTSAPSPNNKIQGLVVLLYGRGGFGKSTLLRKYRGIVLTDMQNSLLNKTAVSSVIDWEFAVEGKRGLFNPPAGQEVDAPEYFKVLCGHLATALGKEPKEFKEYQAAVKAVEEARKKADSVLEGLKSDDRYGWLRGLAVEVVTSAVRTYVPGSKAVLDDPTIKKSVDEAAKLTQEQVSQVHARLHDRLGNKLGDYLDPALQLGLALGRDLAGFAKNFPLLLLFDTYEEADEGDRLLRMVMGAAGLRVGWVTASRDNLWAGAEQRERSIAMEYSYKEIVPSDRALAVDFNAGGVGAFTSSDIKEYFDLLCQHVQHSPPLPNVTASEAERLWDVTKGVPLAVKIAAGLYLETANVDTITEHVEGKKEIVGQMVRRYLLHARDDQNERARLYGLALLRRADSPVAVAAALQLEPEQTKTNYAIELSRLQRRYSFIFTEKEGPSLHQEVRHFLRLWLLERCKEPHIQALNEHLMEADEAELKKLEERRQYASLKERLQDDEWVGVYLDLAEQQFWLDPVEGVRYILPIMIAVTHYRSSVFQETLKVGEFFKTKLGNPYLERWEQVTKALSSTQHMSELDHILDCRKALEKLTRSAEQHPIIFPQPLPNYSKELEALLWWQLGDEEQEGSWALECYEKALTLLEQENALKEDTASAYIRSAWMCFEDKAYAEGIDLLNRATELAPDDAWNYHYRGFAYSKLKEYRRAIQDYKHANRLSPDHALTYYYQGIAFMHLNDYGQATEDFTRTIELDPTLTKAYTLRGIAYYRLKEYERATKDYNRAVELDPKDANTYIRRGLAYLWLKNAQAARTDYKHSYALDPTDGNAAWMAEWATMNRERSRIETAQRLEKIAKGNPQYYAAYVCRGVALGLQGRLKDSLAELEKAIPLEQEQPDAYFWKGMLCAYYYKGRYRQAMEAIEKALELELPPVLLTPLYWLEKDRPDFFEQYAKPLLEKYGI